MPILPSFYLKTPIRKRNYMGQKVNPIGLRVGINRGWDSIWFAKKREYGKFLIEDYKIRNYIKKNVVNSGVSQVIIERTSRKCIVSIYTSRPGFVIGKKGSDVDKIKKNLSTITSSEISLNIKEVKKPELNAYLVAENIAQQLVKRIAYRKTMKRAMQSALRLGAKGIRVCLAGRLAGNEIARTEWLREGSVPLHTFRADVDYAEAEALTTYGIIGIKVWIYKGEILSINSNKNNKEKENATTSKNKT
jgi:small subunit ribosomal protein S3